MLLLLPYNHPPLQSFYFSLQKTPFGNISLHLLTFSYILPVWETFLFNILHKLQAVDCFSQLQHLLGYYWEIYLVIAH